MLPLWLMKNYVHLSIDNASTFNRPALTEFLKPMNAVEYIPGCWLIDTDVSVSDFATRLRTTLGNNAQATVLEAEIDQRVIDFYPQAVRTFVQARAAA